MKTIAQQAIVMGGSIGGLLAARALADYYQQVTVLERDILPLSGKNRKGVPQDRHAHALSLFCHFPGILNKRKNRENPER